MVKFLASLCCYLFCAVTLLAATEPWTSTNLTNTNTSLEGSYAFSYGANSQHSAVVTFTTPSSDGLLFAIGQAGGITYHKNNQFPAQQLNNSFSVKAENGTLTFTMRGAATNQTLTLTETPGTSGTQHTVAYSFNRVANGSDSTATVYFDGKKAGTLTLSTWNGPVQAFYVTNQTTITAVTVYTNLLSEEEGVALTTPATPEVPKPTPTATVLRAHPWLTRGLAQESLIGVRFANGYGGAVDSLSFKFTLKNCSVDDFSNFHLWIQPGPAYAFYESSAVRLDNGIMTQSVTTDTNSITVTFENPNYKNVAQNRAQGWVYTGAGDRLWVTASINSAISPEAEITAELTNESFHLATNTYTVSDAATKPIHRVFPYRYRINAYLRNERIKGALPNRNSDIFDDAPQQRVANLTDLTSINLYPIYNATTDAFELSWDRKGVSAGTVSDTAGIERLRTLRDTYHPKARLHMSLTMGSTLTLDSMNTGSAFNASALGHAAGDRYRAAFVQAIVTLLKTKGLDGLDIDWEYPNTYNGNDNAANGEYEKYGALLRDLAEAFFPYGWDLAMCTNQSGWRIPGGEVLAAADFINAMAYGPWPQFLGNQVMTSGINVCTSRKVPKRRIVVGQAMYSNAKYQLGWDECTQRLATLGYPQAWDCDAYAEAWSYNNKNGNYLYFTGPTTYRAKCNRVRLEGYGGVMSWGYYSDVKWDSGLSLAMHQAQAIWPESGVLVTPPRSSDGYYELDSEDDWAWLRANPTQKARLTADITFTHDPLPITGFSGELDGDGHTLTLPKDTWIATFSDTGLFGSTTGSLYNFTLDVAGRVITRADRAEDTDPETKTVTGAPKTAALVTDISSGARLENITVRLRQSAEIQGILGTAAVVGSAYCDANHTTLIKHVTADIAGTIRIRTETATGTLYDVNYGAAGGLIGWWGGPESTGLKLENCTVTLRPTAIINAETGSQSSAGAGIGHVNNTNAQIAGLHIKWMTGATVKGKQTTNQTPMPWVASYSCTQTSYPKASGTITAASTSFPWTTWWLQTEAPLKRPGLQFYIR